MSQPIRVLLADDHNLVRAGLRALLEKMPGVEVVAEAGTGRDALRQIGLHHPNIVLMDIMMPELNGLEATARVAHRFPAIKVIVLSMNSTHDVVLQALQSGASGYLLKSISAAELELALQAVARGETFLSSAISKQVVEACLRRNGETTTSLGKLTPRQREVLQLIAEGETTRSIAKKLGISVKTAESYRRELMDAIDVHDIAGLTRFAIRIGLVSPDN